MDALPAEVLANILKFLPIQDVARFEQVNKSWARAIDLYRFYFKRPQIRILFAMPNGIDMNFHVFAKSYVTNLKILPNGSISSVVKTRAPLPESSNDQFNSLKSVLRWIKWNVSIMYENWGHQTDTHPRIPIFRLTALDTRLMKDKHCDMLIRALVEENCLIDTLCLDVERRNHSLEKMAKIAVLMAKNKVLKKVEFSHVLVNHPILIPIAQDISDCTINTTLEKVLEGIIYLKDSWGATRALQEDAQPWSIRFRFRIMRWEGQLAENVLPMILDNQDDSTFSVNVSGPDKLRYYYAYVSGM